MQGKFLTAEWRKLAIANYLVDPDVLKPYLPYNTELDFWNGKCYISLVGFRFLNTRLKGISIPLHRDFEEINLRFYVRYKEENIWKRGVTFIKEIVPRRAITLMANSLYGEKYVTYPTKHNWKNGDGSIEVCYEWKHKGNWDRIAVKAEPDTMEILPDSEEEFITEHYWGYTHINSNRTSEYQVEHPKWKIYPVINHEVEVRFEQLYGEKFGFLDRTIPDSIMLAEGSEIIIWNAGRIERIHGSRDLK